MNNSKKCFSCSKDFNITEEWKIFCSSACSFRWRRTNKYECFYCGDMPSDRDHVFPESGKHFHKNYYRNRELVPVCKECNHLLGANNFISIEDRVEWLKEKIIKKYKLNKDEIVWLEDELNELNDTLKQYIGQQISIRKSAEQRIAFINTRLEKLSPVQPEVQRNACGTHPPSLTALSM